MDLIQDMNKLVTLFLGALLLLAISVTVASSIAFQQEPWAERIAVIPINGGIVTGGVTSIGDVDASSVISEIEAADSNPSVKAILIEINSPGGSPVASAEIADAIKSAKKPTVAWIGEVGASGGYWVASAADKVVAHPMSLTGSIGAYSMVIEAGGLMDKLGLAQETIKSGEFKDIGSPYRNMTDAEKAIFQETVLEIKEQFVDTVAKNRNMSKESVEAIADGRPFLGTKALKLGLVDSLGSEKDAIKLAAKLGNTTTENTLYYGQNTNPLNTLLSQSSASLGYGISKGFSSTSGMQLR